MDKEKLNMDVYRLDTLRLLDDLRQETEKKLVNWLRVKSQAEALRATAERAKRQEEMAEVDG